MYEAEFQNELIKDERIQWSGQPDVSKTFSRADIFLVPFSMMWGGFAIFWELSVLFTRGKSGEGAPIFMALWGIPFVVIGLYFIFGRFFYKKMKKQKIFYALTNKRVLILTKLFGSNLQAEYINTLPSINKSIGKDGAGNIVFGNLNMAESMHGNTGMDFFGSSQGKVAPIFYDIKDANQVCEMVNNIRNS